MWKGNFYSFFDLYPLYLKSFLASNWLTISTCWMTKKAVGSQIGGKLNWNDDLWISTCIVVQLLCCVQLFATPGLQHIRFTCPLLSPGVCSNSYQLSRWYILTISSSAAPFSFCPQSSAAAVCFPVSWLFASGGQSIGAYISASSLPMNVQGWFPLGLTVLIPCYPSDPQESFPTPQFKSINSLALSLLWGPTLTSIHDYWKKP